MEVIAIRQSLMSELENALVLSEAAESLSTSVLV